MNIFNRVVLILILLFFIVVSFVSIVNEFTGLFKWSDVASKIINPEGNINPYISTLALLFVIALCVFLLLLEFYRKKTRIAKIYNVATGKAMITVETISQQIKESVLQISGLKNLKVDITPKSGGVIIGMLAELNQNLNIPEKMTEIIKTAKDVSTTKLNIKVIDTKLTITNLIPDEAPGRLSEQKPQKEKVEEDMREQIASGSSSQSGGSEVTRGVIHTGDNEKIISESDDKVDE